MSILHDEGQQAIATESRRVAEARRDQARLLGLLEQTGAYEETFWRTAVEQGWTGLAIPEEFGGLGLSLVELGIVAQAIGATAGSAPAGTDLPDRLVRRMVGEVVGKYRATVGE